MALREPAAFAVGSASIALTIALIWGGPIALFVAALPVAVYVVSSDSVTVTVDGTDQDEPRNPDYYCTECGLDEESGGEPAVCTECHDDVGDS